MIDEGTVHIDLTVIGGEALGDADPRQIGAFPLRAVLGAGGMGRVYLGVAPEGYTAVKQVLPELARDKLFLRRFGHELDSQARLPAGVSARLLAADRTASPPWFATEYVPGVTLYDGVYLNGGPLPAETVWVLLRELAGRLDQVARLDMTHRDLKPSNVMLTAEGVTLIDFGIARAADQSSVTAVGVLIGTPGYMAPEQVAGRRDLTSAVDVFSLGSVLAFAATGEPAFGGGTSADLFFRILHVDPDLDALRALDPDLAEVVARCLAKDPAHRPTAAALAEIATAHARPGPPTWPSSISEPITARRAFARTAQAADPAEPAAPAETEFDEDPKPPSLSLPPSPSPSPSPDEKHQEQRGRQEQQGQLLRSRKALLLLLALVLLAGTAGTLIGMHKLPFVTSAGPKTSGSGAQALPGATGRNSASAKASAAAHSSTSVSTASTGTAKAQPSSSSNAASSATTSNSSGNNNPGTTKTTSAPATHTTTSGGGSGSSGSDATVVSTTYSEIKNVATSLCVSANAGGGIQSCDGGTDVGFKEVAASGGIKLQTDQDLCLLNNESSAGDAYAFSCSWNASLQTWTIGTRTSRGGELVNSGECLTYSSTATYNLAMASCNSSDPDQLWYDGGAV